MVDFDYEFFKEIILVLIPVIIGAMTARIVTNRWQIRNEKSKIKRKILEEFTDSIKKCGELLNVLYLNIGEKYYLTNYVLNENDEVNVTPILNFPKEEDEPPSHYFSSDIKKLKDDLYATASGLSTCLSSLRLYYRNEDLEREFKNLNAFVFAEYKLIIQLIHSKNEQEFIDNNKEFYKWNLIFMNKVEIFEKRLIDEKIHKLII